MVANFLSIMWNGEAFHGLGVQDVESSTLVGNLFPLDGEKRGEGKTKEKKKKKKITAGKEHFHGAGSTLLAVQGVTAVRCN
jgi:hypothetical protein